MDIARLDSSVKPRKERNGLIDLYRFLLSLVVAKSHSLFAVGGPYFGPGRVCVEFFFVLSGYLFFSFLDKRANGRVFMPSSTHGLGNYRKFNRINFPLWLFCSNFFVL